MAQPAYESLAVDNDIALRALTEHDAQTVYDLTTANQAYLAQYLPWADKVESVSDSASFIDSVQSERAKGQGYGFGIFASGTLIGHISLMHLSTGKTPEIGYWVAESASGQGITTKAAGVLTEFGFKELGLDKILIRAQEGNVASNKIAQTLGYSFDGEHIGTEGIPHNHWIKEKPGSA